MGDGERERLLVMVDRLENKLQSGDVLTSELDESQVRIDITGDDSATLSCAKNGYRFWYVTQLGLMRSPYVKR